VRNPEADPGRWWSLRRRAAALDRALDAVLAGLEPSPEEVERELAAARALGTAADTQVPPDEVHVVLRAALAAGEARTRPAPRARPRVRNSVWRPAAAIALLAAGLIALTGIRPASRPRPDQAALARNLQLVSQQMAQVEAKAADGDVADVDARVQQLRAALLTAEQAAAQLNPGDPQEADLLAILEGDIVSLNQLLARLHLHLSPLPPLPHYLPPQASPQPGRPSPHSAPAAPSTTTTTTASPASVPAITTVGPAPTGPVPVVPNSTLAFGDAEHGWLVVPGQPSGSPPAWSASRLLATSDGGRTWSPQLTETPAPLVGVDFADVTHGWVVAGALGPSGSGGGQAVYGAALLRTTDGGATWRQVGEPPSPLGQVHFTDALRGWGVTAQDQVVSTSDGGVTWQPAADGSSAPPPVSALCVTAGGSVAWAATPGTPVGSGAPEVLRTSDGGAHWSVSFRGGPEWGVEQADIGCAGLGAWAVFDLSPGAGRQPAVVERTSDAGIQWSAVIRPPAQTVGPAPVSGLDRPGPFSVVDANTVRFTEACSPCSLPQVSVVSSDDGGQSYSTAALAGSASPADGVAFLDADHGFAATGAPPDAGGPEAEAQVFATADGGRTWRLVFTG
jgi:photosystem II stability/assembly factor-like uncharacterized protein